MLLPNKNSSTEERRLRGPTQGSNLFCFCQCSSAQGVVQMAPTLSYIKAYLGRLKNVGKGKDLQVMGCKMVSFKSLLMGATTLAFKKTL